MAKRHERSYSRSRSRHRPSRSPIPRKSPHERSSTSPRSSKVLPTQEIYSRRRSKSRPRSNSRRRSSTTHGRTRSRSRHRSRSSHHHSRRSSGISPGRSSVRKPTSVQKEVIRPRALPSSWVSNEDFYDTTTVANLPLPRRVVSTTESVRLGLAGADPLQIKLIDVLWLHEGSWELRLIASGRFFSALGARSVRESQFVSAIMWALRDKKIDLDSMCTSFAGEQSLPHITPKERKAVFDKLGASIVDSLLINFPAKSADSALQERIRVLEGELASRTLGNAPTPAAKQPNILAALKAKPKQNAPRNEAAASDAGPMDEFRRNDREEILENSQPANATPAAFKAWTKSLHRNAKQNKAFQDMHERIKGAWNSIPRAERPGLDRILSQWGLSCKSAADASETTLLNILAMVNCIVG